MREPRPDLLRKPLRDVLREAAKIVSGNESLESMIGAVCGLLLRTASAAEVTVAVDGPGAPRIRWRRTAQGLLVCDDPIDEAHGSSVLRTGKAWVSRTNACAPLHDDGRVVGAVSIASRTERYDEDALDLCEAFAAYLSLALQKSALHDRARRLEELTVVDALTGIPNRRAFDLALGREWLRAMRSKRPMAVALLDIDHFKRYNDAYGHPRGDACLQLVARACHASVVRASDCFARYGGEEFGLIVHDADEVVAARIAERLRAAVESQSIQHASTPNGMVTASVGVATVIPKRGMTAIALLDRADRALYRAKALGRNRVIVLDSRADADGPEPRRIEPSHNLPQLPGELIGRDPDVARVDDLMSRHRVVTLVGAGGVGKTRLALEVARRRLVQARDGAYLIELAALSQPEQVVAALGAPFGLEHDAVSSTSDGLIAALRDRRVLLVVDNCEHLVGATADAIAALSRGAPYVSVLATSREPLNVPGEATYRVPPHTVPPPGEIVNAGQALRFSAVGLFVERAQAAVDGFALSDQTAPIVADICRRLDGIALAIELAAARVRVLDVARIAELLDSRFRLLTDGSRTALPHQKTLRATIDWSFELLDPEERTLFSRLGIFAGGCPLDAILAVCAEDDLPADVILDGLAALVEKSLVLFEAPRYRLLESMREYARERRCEDPAAARVAARHARFYRDMLERTSLAEGNGTYRAWVTPLLDEIDNIRAAFNWALEDGHDVALAAAIAASLVETSSLGRWNEWADWNTRALDALPADAPADLRGRLLTRRAELAARYGAFGGTGCALASAREACALLGETAESRRRLEALNAYANALERDGSSGEAERVARAGLELARIAHDFVYQASFLRRLATIVGASDPTEAHLMIEESVALCRVLENDFGLALAQHALSHLAFQRGQLEEAVVAARSAADVRREMGDRRGLVFALADLAEFELSLGRLGGVDAVLREALAVVRRTENLLGLAAVAQSIASFAAAIDRPREAAQLLGFADHAFTLLAGERETVRASQREALGMRLAESLDGDRLGMHLLAGAALDHGAAGELAARVLGNAAPAAG